MYKALIVDDEWIIRRGIGKLLDCDPEIAVVGEAEDGEIALELAKALHPDMIFVDINMPFLNGLDFVEAMKEVDQRAVMIVITGYDDFKYAQQALKLGVFDYLLKPLQEEEFYASIAKGKELLGLRKSEQKYLEWAHLEMQQRKPFLIREFLNEWLEGHLTEIEFEEKRSYLDLDLPMLPGVLLAHITPTLDSLDSTTGWNDELLMYAVENIAAELFGQFGRLFLLRNQRNHLVLFADVQDADQWKAAADFFRNSVLEYLPVTVSIMLDTAGQLSEVPEVYERIAEKIHQKIQYPLLVRRTLQMLEQNYQNSSLSLPSIADELHISPQHLSRIFRHETGTTFSEYLTRIRVMNAMRLLEKDLKMFEIADQVGYSNQHYFSNAFKKITGQSPKEYRQSKLQPDQRQKG